MQSWDTPMYSPATVGRLIKLRPERVRRWLQGYEFEYKAGPTGEIRTGHKAALIKRQTNSDSHYASFLDLIDLLFVKKFLNHGISLQKLRRALDEASKLIGGHHFAQRKFFTDGKNVYLQVYKDADALMELLSGGQWVIPSLIKELAHQIEFDEPTGFARRWYPLGPKISVVIDPRISFGKPVIASRGIATANIYDLYQAENKNIETVCSWMNLKKTEVEAAVEFEEQLAA